MSVDSSIITETRAWVSSVVIGLNFCPFAKREFERESIRYSVSKASSLEDALAQLQQELEHLDRHPEVETTLLILPTSFLEFADYLELVSIAEDLLIDLEYEGKYQLATFHPEYVFADSANEDPANYTNRAPYPILHLLREESLERAITRYPHAEEIPEKNISCARALGIDKMRALLSACYQR